MKNRHNIQINVQGLHPLKEDVRDFSLAGFFDQIQLKDIPSMDFCIEGNRVIKDQGSTDYCSAYAVTTASSYQEEVDLCPEYQFFKTKEIMGNPDEWGCSLREACKSAVKYGSLPVTSLETVQIDITSRVQVLNPSSWPSFFDVQAYNHRKQTYFQVDGRYDTFDNIRAALWQNIKDKRAIVVGACWKQEWTDAPGGVIPEGTFAGGFGHAFILIGQKKINNQLYLVAQLSNGSFIGDNGLFYFPRSVVNKEMSPFGAFMFQDVARETVDEAIKSASPTWYSKLIDYFTNLINH